MTEAPPEKKEEKKEVPPEAKPEDKKEEAKPPAVFQLERIMFDSLDFFEKVNYFSLRKRDKPPNPDEGRVRWCIKMILSPVIEYEIRLERHGVPFYSWEKMECPERQCLFPACQSMNHDLNVFPVDVRGEIKEFIPKEVKVEEKKEETKDEAKKEEGKEEKKKEEKKGPPPPIEYDVKKSEISGRLSSLRIVRPSRGCCGNAGKPHSSIVANVAGHEHPLCHITMGGTMCLHKLQLHLSNRLDIVDYALCTKKLQAPLVWKPFGCCNRVHIDVVDKENQIVASIDKIYHTGFCRPAHPKIHVHFEKELPTIMKPIIMAACVVWDRVTFPESTLLGKCISECINKIKEKITNCCKKKMQGGGAEGPPKAELKKDGA